MAEPSSGDQADATQETAPSAGDIQQQGFTEQQLTAIIGRVVGGHMENQQRQFDSRLTKVEQLAPQIEAVMGTSRRTEAMVQRIFKGTTTEEDVAEFEAAATQQAAAEVNARAAAETAAERDALKEQLSRQDGGEQAVWDTTVTLILERGREEGLDEATIERLKPKTRVAADGDPFGYKGMYREWAKALRTESVKRQQEAEIPVEPVQVRGGGSGGTALENYRKALREGGPTPSAAEIDKITAAYR